MVKANPNLVPNEPFYNDMFPGAKNLYITGSPSANIFYDVYSNYAGSWLDTLNDMDRIRPGERHMHFEVRLQHLLPAAELRPRNLHQQRLSRTTTRRWSRCAARFRTAGASTSTTRWGMLSTTALLGNQRRLRLLQDAFNPRAFYGSSDFDARHTITADAVVQIPVGKGKALSRIFRAG